MIAAGVSPSSYPIQFISTRFEDIMIIVCRRLQVSASVHNFTKRLPVEISGKADFSMRLAGRKIKMKRNSFLYSLMLAQVGLHIQETP